MGNSYAVSPKLLIDIPKNVQLAKSVYKPRKEISFRPHRIKSGSTDISKEFIENLISHVKKSTKPVLYVGGGCLNSGPKASEELRKFAELTNIPVTTTLHGLGCYPGNGKLSIGMLGMHGTYEAN